MHLYFRRVTYKSELLHQCHGTLHLYLRRVTYKSDVLVFKAVAFGAMPPLDIFKKLTDRYPCRGAVKGGFTWFKPKVIVFTRNSHPFNATA